MDEQTARERALSRIALGNAANSLKRGHQSNKHGKGKGNRRSHASAHATSSNKQSSNKEIICYKCGEKGHIAPKCPHHKKSQPPTDRTVAKGRAATTTNTGIEEEEALVCVARVINYFNNPQDISLETDNTVLPTNFANVNYENNVNLAQFLQSHSYATIWFEKFDVFTPMVHVEPPHTQAFLHDRPMEECLLDSATIFELDNTDSVHQSYRQIMNMGIMPAVKQVFTPQPWNYPIQFDLWLDMLQFFYPIGAPGPNLHLRNSTGQYFFTYKLPSRILALHNI